MAAFVDRREQGLANVGLVEARGDAHIAGGELGAKRMMGFVDAAALEVVSEPLGHGDVEGRIRAACQRGGENPLVWPPQRGRAGGGRRLCPNRKWGERWLQLAPQ